MLYYLVSGFKLRTGSCLGLSIVGSFQTLKLSQLQFFDFISLAQLSKALTRIKHHSQQHPLPTWSSSPLLESDSEAVVGSDSGDFPFHEAQ
jgi:hypothetical protein